MAAKHIIHAVGPAFQEENTEEKLKTTVTSSLKRAEEKGIQQVALPLMGAGFYGVPMDTSAKITLGTIKDYLATDTKLKEVVVVALDNRELKPFKTQFEAIA